MVGDWQKIEENSTGHASHILYSLWRKKAGFEALNLAPDVFSSVASITPRCCGMLWISTDYERPGSPNFAQGTRHGFHIRDLLEGVSSIPRSSSSLFHCKPFCYTDPCLDHTYPSADHSRLSRRQEFPQGLPPGRGCCRGSRHSARSKFAAQQPVRTNCQPSPSLT